MAPGVMCNVVQGVRCNGGWRERARGDVPFEFICEIARARALAKAGHVEGGAAAARHVDGMGERSAVMVVGGDMGMGGGGAGCERVERQVQGWIKTDGSRWPERAAGLLQAQPLSEPRSRQEPRQLKSRAVVCRHPVNLLLSASRATCGSLRVFREVRLDSPNVQEITILRFDSANCKDLSSHIPA